jgi:predicted secreted protein
LLRLDESYNGREIALTVGQEFEVVLPENPLPHFRWRFEVNGWPVCEVLNTYFEESLRLGTSGGSRIWQFQARQVGSATIDLVYEKRERPVVVSHRRFSLHVTVTM